MNDMERTISIMREISTGDLLEVGDEIILYGGRYEVTGITEACCDIKYVGDED